MKEFDVTITETLKLTVSVEASSKEEAEQMVNDQWRAGDHVLDADWCRRMDAAKADADLRGRRNLETAMMRHHCKEKLAGMRDAA